LPYYLGIAQMTEKDVIRQLPEEKRIGVISSEEPESMKITDFELKFFKRFGELSFSWFSR
jgi:hypothetical protein